MSRRDPEAGEQGFSIIEMMITVAILSIAVVAMLGTLSRATETAQFESDRNQALDQLRLMSATFSKDVRQGVRVTAASGTFNSVTFDTYVDGAVTSVTWRAVDDGDEDRFERVVGAVSPTVFVVDLTTTAVFAFPDGLDNLDDIDSIALNLATQLDVRHPSVEHTAEVEMRNVL